jgi:hypothetical protein
MSTKPEETKSVFVGVRLPKSLYEEIENMARFMGLPISEIIRFLLNMALLILGPDTTLRDIIKDRYIELLKKNPDAVLEMNVLDLLPTYGEIIEKIRQQRGNQS